MFDYFHSVLRPVNESKLLVGMMMIFLNVGSKYIDLGLSKTQEQVLREGLAREMLIFAISFMGTRDIPTAIILTASFTILSNMLLNENSKYCVIPNKMKKIQEVMDTSGDGMVSHEEEKRAIEILEKAKQQRMKDVQGTFLSYMNAHQNV
jgi:hypothetical protein